MFRKLHSNRDPRDTLLKEIKKEFSVYFGKAETGLSQFLRQYPKPAYAVMLALMAVSLILSFTVFRKHEPAHPDPPAGAAINKDAKPASVLSPVSGGFTQILQTTTALKQTVELKQQIDTLLSKRNLTAADSIRLAQSLDRLQHLQQTLTVKP